MSNDISPDQPELLGEFLTLAKRLAGGEIEGPEFTVSVKRLPVLTEEQLDSLAEYALAQAHLNPKFGFAVAQVGDVSAVAHQSDPLIQAKAAWYLGRAANKFYRPHIAAEAILRAKDLFEQLNEPFWVAACDWQYNVLPWARPNLENCLSEVEQALETLSSPNSHLSHYQIECRLTLAYIQILLQHLEDAYQNLDICEAYFRSIQDQLGLLACCRLRGVGYFRQSKFDEAIELTEKGLSLAKAYPSPVEEAIFLGRLGGYYFKRQIIVGNYQQAEEKLLDAINLFGQLEISFWESLCRNQLGDVLISQGRFIEANDVLTANMKALREFNLKAPLASTLIALGWLETNRGNYDQGLKYLLEAQKFILQIGNKYMLGVISMHLGELYLEMGRYQLALHYLEEGVEIFKVLGSPGRIAECCLRLARCWRLLGRPKRALKALDDVELNAKEAKQENIFPYLHIRRAESFFVQGATDKVIDALQNAILESKKLEDKTGLALSHRLLGETLSDKGLYPEAAENLEKAENIVTELGVIAEQAASKAAWGNHYRNLGEANLARIAWQQAIEIAQNLAPDVIWQAQAGLAELAVEAGHFEKALSHYREVVAALNRLREDMWQPALAGFFLERPIHALEKAIQLAVKTDATEDIFYFIEASKAQVLAKQFNQPIVADKEERSLELSNLAGEIRWRDEQIRGIKQGSNQLLLSELLKLQSELRHLVQEYDRLRGRIERRKNSSNYQLLPDKTFLKTEEFIKAANNHFGEGWVALDYYLTNKEGICICLSKESCQVFQLGFPGRVRYIYESINRLTLRGKWEIRDLERLGQWLLPDEILEVLSENKLLIIAPHRHLNYLPWSALTTDSIPLVNRTIPVLVPSLFSLMALMNRPVSDSVIEGGLLVAVSDFAGRHWSLASVIDEVEFLLEMYPESKSLMNQDATWSAFQDLADRQGLDSFKFLHIASHAFADTLSGRLSGLAFFDRDVWLDELRGCGPYPGLVTLSACSGSKSRYFEGDEQIGLATTFLAEGANQVIASLWPIQDEEVARLMKKFYNNLLLGFPPSLALALTQRWAVHSDMPFTHWAGFRCTGLPA